LNKYGGETMHAESAGIETGSLNPYAVAVMKEIGIDISSNKTQEVFDVFSQGKMYNAVVTVCDESHERCPVFPGVVKRISWSLPDPAGFKGTEEEILQHTRVVRDQIKEKVMDLVIKGATIDFWMITQEPLLS
jgi:arsenate reductase